MLCLAIDLHRKQMTINLRGEDGEPLLRRQVSTWGEDPRTFLADVQRRAGDHGFVAILEVCGFHGWLTELLPQFGCREVVPLVSRSHVQAIGAALDTGTIASKYSVPARPATARGGPMIAGRGSRRPRKSRRPSRGFTKGCIGEPSARGHLPRGKNAARPRNA